MSRHPLDAALACARQYADTYVPDNKRVVLVIVPSDGPAELPPCPPKCTCLDVPTAKNLPRPDEGDYPAAERVVRQPAVAWVVIAALLQDDVALELSDVMASDPVKDSGYSQSSVEKTLQQLAAAGLVTHTKSGRNRGYRRAGDA